MPKKLTTEEFIERSTKIHDKKYDYSKVIYKTGKDKVVINCPEHGEFTQSPSDHLQGKGCRKCAALKFGQSRKLDTEEFIERSNKAHGDLYNYDKTEYINSETKVTVTCPKHGDFQQFPRDHYKGRGCSKCGDERVGAHSRMTLNDFLTKANTIHNNFYIYDKLVEVNGMQSVGTITCPLHGDFSQQLGVHIHAKAGCPECGKIKAVQHREFAPGWSYTDWENAGNNSSNFEGFSLYVIKCYSEKESFIKVGKTFRNIHKRFQSKKEMPYEYIILEQIYGSARPISELEHKLHSHLQTNKYQPKIPFHEQFECFTEESYNTIKELLNDTT